MYNHAVIVYYYLLTFKQNVQNLLSRFSGTPLQRCLIGSGLIATRQHGAITDKQCLIHTLAIWSVGSVEDQCMISYQRLSWIRDGSLVRTLLTSCSLYCSIHMHCHIYWQHVQQFTLFRVQMVAQSTDSAGWYPRERKKKSAKTAQGRPEVHQLCHGRTSSKWTTDHRHTSSSQTLGNESRPHTEVGFPRCVPDKSLPRIDVVNCPKEDDGNIKQKKLIRDRRQNMKTYAGHHHLDISCRSQMQRFSWQP